MTAPKLRECIQYILNSDEYSIQEKQLLLDFLKYIGVHYNPNFNGHKFDTYVLKLKLKLKDNET